MSNEVYPWELWQKEHGNNWFEPQSKRQEKHLKRRRLRYAAGAVGGIIVVDFVKRQIGKVPVIGHVLSPIIGMCVPTLLAGTLLGAAAVYGYEKGDPLAARELVPVAEKKIAEASNYVKDNLDKALQQLTAPIEEAYQDFQRDVDRAERQRLLPPPPQHDVNDPAYQDLVTAVERITQDLFGSSDFAPRR